MPLHTRFLSRPPSGVNVTEGSAMVILEAEEEGCAMVEAEEEGSGILMDMDYESDRM